MIHVCIELGLSGRFLINTHSIILAIDVNEVSNIRQSASIALCQCQRQCVIDILLQINLSLLEVLVHLLLGVLHDPELFRFVQIVNNRYPCLHLRIKSKVCCRQSGRLSGSFTQKFAVVIAALTVRSNKDVLAVLNYPAAANISLPVGILTFNGECVMIRFLKRVRKVTVLSLSGARFPGASKVIVINITLMADLLSPCLILCFLFVCKFRVVEVGEVVNVFFTQSALDTCNNRSLGVRDIADLLLHHCGNNFL